MIEQFGAIAAGMALLIVAVMLFPLRSGAGEHAHAGSGTVTVDRLRASLTTRATATRTEVTPPRPALAPMAAAAPLRAVPDEEIVWPSDDEPEHVGKHRLRTEDWVCHRLATMLALHAHHARRPIRASGPPPRIDIRLHSAVI
ncbi:hypothetical protein [Saccharopolyspora gloriosae]|uniref:hypothetical protein n=1 Tax=Saccharopolyspora gloriosae TaxID=455344 RepID=UPI001FB7291C|nr:hypothetical protein [Saccharopolyspora gloriosae]